MSDNPSASITAKITDISENYRASNWHIPAWGNFNTGDPSVPKVNVPERDSNYLQISAIVEDDKELRFLFVMKKSDIERLHLKVDAEISLVVKRIRYYTTGITLLSFTFFPTFIVTASFRLI